MTESTFDYDLLVIGAGSGGVRAARRAAATGARVGVIESSALGGTCVNVGCVPKKLFTFAAHFAEDFIDAKGYGWHIQDKTWDWPTLRDNKTQEIKRLNMIYEGMLQRAGVKIITGHGSLVDEHTVAVAEQLMTANKILIATGGQAFVPDIPGRELAVTSDEMFYLEKFPKRALIVGGGFIAMEFAGILYGLGAATTLIYRGTMPLRGFDDTARTFVCDEMRRKGIEIVTQTDVVKLEQRDTGIHVLMTSGESREVDLVLFATGRTPNTATLGLNTVGVATTNNGTILVDDDYRTNIPSIFALGDVINRIQLTPMATKEAMAFVETQFKNNPTRVDYQNVPMAVFTNPELACVGLTEAAARHTYHYIEVYQSEFLPMKLSLSLREEEIMMKLIVDKASQKVVGAHMVGVGAAEIIQGIAVAIRAGATKSLFDTTVGIHPTSAEEFVTMYEPVQS